MVDYFRHLPSPADNFPVTQENFVRSLKERDVCLLATLLEVTSLPTRSGWNINSAALCTANPLLMPLQCNAGVRFHVRGICKTRNGYRNFLLC